MADDDLKGTNLKKSIKHKAATFEVDTYALRGHGVSQDDVHPAIQALAQVEPIQMNFCSKRQVTSNLEELFARMPPSSIQFLSPMEEVIANFFSSSKCFSAYKDDSGALMPGNLPLNCNIILCDHMDGESIAVSRLFHRVFSQRTPWLEDQDMSARDYATIVRSGKPSNAMFVFSQQTLHSAVQLARLGLLVKVHPQMHMVPVAIGVSFDFPDEAYVDELESGDLLLLGSNPAQKLALLAGDKVTMKEIAVGLVHTMSFLISFVNVPLLKQKDSQKTLLDLCSRATSTGRRTSFSKLPPLETPSTDEVDV
jgi:hypothetical protein